MKPLMRTALIALLGPCWLAACNTAPIPPGKPVDIPTALEKITADLCTFKQKFAQKAQGQGVAVDSYRVELALSVDGARNPPVAVAPDIAFMPTVSYGQTITIAKDSKLVVTFKDTGTASLACEGQ
ncbi:MAG: hypothetical protein JO278_12975 [Dyella sp.]|nr:hypothetical protein [Dyella sp.]